MARIAVVEDDPGIAELVGLYLGHEGHEVESFVDGAVALRAYREDPRRWALLLVDLMLPGLDGRGLVRRIRDESTVPIIMLTALDDPRDLLEGFALGADDYLTKPFDARELVARVTAVLRRSLVVASTSASIDETKVGDLTISADARTATVAGDELPLRPKEFDLLLTLILHRGAAMSRSQLLERVWHDEVEGDTRTVDMHISRLRERLRSAGASVEIETVRSFGYRLRSRARR